MLRHRQGKFFGCTRGETAKSDLSNFCLVFSYPGVWSLQYKSAMNNAVHYSFAGRNWRLFTSLEASSAEMTGDYLDSWLRDSLHPLALPAVFLEKVITSAHDAVVLIPSGVGRLRLSVFTPDPLVRTDQTWGFFRMEKTNGIPESTSAGIYEIVFYLYAEGSRPLD